MLGRFYLFRRFPVRVRSRNRVHLRADLHEEPTPISFGIAACRIRCVQIEVGSIRDVGEARIGAQAFQHRLHLVRGSIQIEGVGGAYKDVNLAAQLWSALSPGCPNNMREIVVIVPVRHNGRIDVSGFPIKHRNRPAIWSAW